MTPARRTRGAVTAIGAGSPAAFSLVELLVVVAVIALLIGVALPSLAGARSASRAVACVSNLRQLALGWAMYARDYDDRSMPLADTSAAGDGVYWWGSDGAVTGAVDHASGFISPYLSAGLGERSVFECPAQRRGTYRPQGRTGEPTSTYGYNGYYLTPPMTPGYPIGHRPWRRVGAIDQPALLMVFADTLLPGDPPSSNALLDPPWLFDGRAWIVNAYPTTSFRHGSGSGPATNTALADGSARPIGAEAGWLLWPGLRIGSAGLENGPRYVPDWKSWSAP